MFPRIEYVDWILPRIEAATHDLGSSDLHADPDAGDGVVPPRLADLPTPDADLRTLVAEAYGVDADRVLVTAGASSANLLAMAVALEESPNADAGTETGESVRGAGTGRSARGADGEVRPGRALVEAPGYEPLVATPRGLGATVDRFPRGRNWALVPDRIARAAEGTSLVVVSNRHNPTGARVDRETLSATAEVAASIDARLLVDEVYAPYGPAGEGVFGGPTAVGLPNTVVTSSLTKFWGFGSLRVGWLVADPGFVERARQVATHFLSVAGPSRTLARRALAARETLETEARERCLRNHDLLRAFVDERDDLSGPVFEGCPYAFLTHESADGDAVSAAAWEEDVLVAPGRFFGVDEGVRVSLGGPPARTETALSAFGDALDRLS